MAKVKTQVFRVDRSIGKVENGKQKQPTVDAAEHTTSALLPLVSANDAKSFAAACEHIIAIGKAAKAGEPIDLLKSDGNVMKADVKPYNSTASESAFADGKARVVGDIIPSTYAELMDSIIGGMKNGAQSPMQAFLNTFKPGSEGGGRRGTGAIDEVSDID